MNITNKVIFFRSVAPLPDYKLLVETIPGEKIIFDFSSRLHTTRYGDLNNNSLFNSVVTDGASLIFKISGVLPIIISTGEFFQLMATNSHK